MENNPNKLKYIALYLPQYHTFPENDKWWGKGFTEWTNVKPAKSYFDCHDQPRVPHEDIGYYSLEDVNVMVKQAEMAKKYGIYGFSYYFYWFDGKILMDKPLLNMLNNPAVDIPFCLFWANHNWTRSWDAGNEEILLEQKYSKKTYTSFIDDISKYIKDKRYIRVDGKPVLLVYQTNHLPDPKEAVDTWRSYAKSQYNEDLYLITIQQNNSIAPHEFGFDAALETAPNFRSGASLIHPDDCPQVESHVEITFYDYLINAFQYILRKEDKYTLFRCVYPYFDNTPRRKHKKGWLFHGATPERFKNFLIEISKVTVDTIDEDRRLLFINAWNEWAESAHLEPDAKIGYTNLEICKEVLSYDYAKLQSSGFDDETYNRMATYLNYQGNIRKVKLWKRIARRLKNLLTRVANSIKK